MKHVASRVLEGKLQNASLPLHLRNGIRELARRKTGAGWEILEEIGVR